VRRLTAVPARPARFLPLVAAALLALASPVRAETLVDLELVLAIDASASIDEAEYEVERRGIAAAFRDPAVLAAIRAGPTGRIAVAITLWGEASIPKDASPWFLIADEAGAEAFAAMIERFPRRVTGGTGLGAGLAEAMRMFDRNGYAAPRLTVDVSGDGRETPPRETVVLMPQARAMALVRGITLNGLALTADEPDLADWYRNNVIAGPRAFVMEIARIEDFAEAIRRKLIREIEEGPAVGARDDMPQHAIVRTNPASE